MGLVRKQGVLITITMYVGVVIGYISWGLVLPNYLAPAALGLIITLRDVSILFSKLSLGGLVPASLRFFPYFNEDKSKLNGFFSFTLGYALIGYLLFSILLLIFKEPILSLYLEKAPEISAYFYYLFPFIFLFVLLEYIGVNFTSLRDYVTYSFFKNVVLRILVLLLVGCFIYFNLDFNVFLKYFISAHYIVLLILCILFYYSSKVGFNFNNIKEILEVGFIKFASYNYLNGFISNTVRYIDGLMIVTYLGVGSAGIYGVGFLMASIIEMPRASLTNALTPLIASYWKEENIEKIAELNKKASLNQLIVGMFLFLCIVINLKDIFSLIKPEYVGGISIVIMIGLSKIVTMSTGMSLYIIINSSHYKFNTINAILKLILIVGTNILLIPIYGINGAAFATLISIISYNIILMLFLYTKLKIQPFTYGTVVVVLLSVIPLLINYFGMFNYGLVVNVFVKLAIVFFMFALPIYFFNISSDLNTIINSVLKKLKSK